MKVLVVGGGAREHAICRSLSKSSAVERIYAAPGNAGIASLASVAAIDPDHVTALCELAERESIDLTVVGPEAPLMAGLADELRARDVIVLGPGRDAAMIEGSKAWARRLCDKYGIPGPRTAAFREPDAAAEYLRAMEPPYVVKADGLAAGKGVTVTDDLPQAVRAVERCLVDRAFGEAGRTVVLEEGLQGQEVSALALTDGRSVVPLVLARDYKRALDGDRGPNTGGMGSLSPVPSLSSGMERVIAEEILRPAVVALRSEGLDYRGVLYAGLMLTTEGPKVLEFNCRFGDPETQAILPRLTDDLLELVVSCARGTLSERSPRWSDEACVAVVLTSGGYPGDFEIGKEITGLPEAEGVEGVTVFHGGTALRDGRVMTAGGRVLTVSALGPDLERARQRAYEASSLVRFDGLTYRKDIAQGASGRP